MEVPWSHATVKYWQHYATLQLTYWGWENMDAISQMKFSDAFLWMESFAFWLKVYKSHHKQATDIHAGVKVYPCQ